ARIIPRRASRRAVSPTRDLGPHRLFTGTSALGPGAILAIRENQVAGVVRGVNGGAGEMMTMSWPALIVLVLIAAVCGAVAKALAGGRGGLVTSIALGFIGALLGPWLAHQLKLSEPL